MVLDPNNYWLHDAYIQRTPNAAPQHAVGFASGDRKRKGPKEAAARKSLQLTPFEVPFSFQMKRSDWKGTPNMRTRCSCSGLRSVERAKRCPLWMTLPLDISWSVTGLRADIVIGTSVRGLCHSRSNLDARAQ